MPCLLRFSQPWTRISPDRYSVSDAPRDHHEQTILMPCILRCPSIRCFFTSNRMAPILPVVRAFLGRHDTFWRDFFSGESVRAHQQNVIDLCIDASALFNVCGLDHWNASDLRRQVGEMNGQRETEQVDHKGVTVLLRSTLSIAFCFHGLLLQLS